MNSWWRKLGIACGVAMLLIEPCAADVIQLANGSVIDGIIVGESDGEVRLKVAWRGCMTLDRAEVAAITPSDAAANDRLLAAWYARYRADQRGLLARQQQLEADTKRLAAQQLIDAKRRRIADDPASRVRQPRLPILRLPALPPRGQERVIVGQAPRISRSARRSR